MDLNALLVPTGEVFSCKTCYVDQYFNSSRNGSSLFMLSMSDRLESESKPNLKALVSLCHVSF